MVQIDKPLIVADVSWFLTGFSTEFFTAFVKNSPIALPVNALAVSGQFHPIYKPLNCPLFDMAFFAGFNNILHKNLW